jgi:glyoxylase-like metal-dependent hydrolase (beta-lactamase superfamily II)
MGASTFVRVNGRGNAWPVFLGGSSSFYDASSSIDLSNASFSIIHCRSNKFKLDEIESEILIDAGHHAIPFLIQHGNRIPEAVVLTHGHLDHTLGLDWVAQSKYYLSNKTQLLKVYASLLVWKFVKQSYPHLEKIIDFRELLPGKQITLDGIAGIQLTAYPVYHGEHAKGASMLCFTTNQDKQILFTGDMLCPILPKKEIEKIKGAELVFIDSNNRYPYPLSNHGSVVPFSPANKTISSQLSDWFEKASLNYLIAPHARSSYNSIYHAYFEEFLDDYNAVSELPHSIFDFAKLTLPQKLNLIHYGGMEDLKYHSASVINSEQLQEWTAKCAQDYDIKTTQFNVPGTGDVLEV